MKITKEQLEIAYDHFKSGKHKPCRIMFGNDEYCCPVRAIEIETKKCLGYQQDFIDGFDGNNFYCGDVEQYNLGVEFYNRLINDGMKVWL